MLTTPDSTADRLQHYKTIADARGSSVIAYVTGDRRGQEAQMSDDIIPLFGDLLDKYDGVERISLFLYTRGGNTLAAWSLVNLLREFCDELEVIVPARCHSAGTLTCLGANKILMTKQSTLGPIDPSVNGPLNPQIPGNVDGRRMPVSVEDVAGYISLATDEGQIRDPGGLAQVFLQLASDVHPIVLGTVRRARGQIQDLAKKMLSLHMEESETQVIDNIVRVLCTDAGSHDYMIYRREAREDLRLPVETPSQDLYETIRSIYLGVRKQLLLDQPFNAVTLAQQNELPHSYENVRGLIETQDGDGYKLIRRSTISRAKTDDGQAALTDAASFEGWERL